MAKPAVKTVVTRDLRKMLAVLSRVVQDACAAVSVAIFIRNPQAVLLLAARRTPRSLSDLGRTNSLCKTARTNTEIKGGQNLISSQRACPSEANRGRVLRFIRNPRAVLLLAACRTPKSDRLLGPPQ